MSIYYNSSVIQGKIMFAKSILFTSLLVCSFSVFVNIESSETPDPDFTQNYNPVYSNSGNQHDRAEDEFSFFQVSTESERDDFVRRFLFDYKKSASEYLIENIVELTDGYTNIQITGLMVDMLSASKEEEDMLERLICLKILKKAINKFDKGQIKRQKLIQVAGLIFMSEPLVDFEWSLKGDPVKVIGFETVFPTAEERLEIVKEPLLANKKSVSEHEMQMIVEETSGYDIDCCKKWVATRIKETKSGSLDQDRLLDCPMSHGRREVVEEILLIAKKSAPESLIQDIVELTNCYDMHTITKLVNRMAKKSKTDSLDRDNCIAILKKATDSISEDRFKKFKLAQIEAVIAGENLY